MLTLLFNPRGVGWARQMDSCDVSTMTEERIQQASHMCDIFKERKNLTLSSIHQTINHQRELGKGPSQGQARRFGGPARARLGALQFSSFTVPPRHMQLILELPAALNDPTQFSPFLWIIKNWCKTETARNIRSQTTSITFHSVSTVNDYTSAGQVKSPE